ncbi:MAG: YafY family transcriptional regulator [Gammaproteobacteria bacterium]|nr:YafY family transcriptional regulator [Gammaproteobacteria bacterium]MDH5692364.1 YafY family transcriptional regulator [Gammaproteobacteria bacterium]
MRRADRLFQIIQMLRHDRVVTARDIAQELEVSERTIYRDVQDLSLSGVPILAEAGVGYRLMQGFDLPPLMFTEDELAALLLGMRMLQVHSDQGLARAARQILQKVEHVIPERLKPELEREDLIVPDYPSTLSLTDQLSTLRAAVKEQKKVFFAYKREDGASSTRTVHPLGLFYWGKVWTLVAWCELRDDFRHFRLDRMNEPAMLDDVFPAVAGRSLEDFLRQYWGVEK